MANLVRYYFRKLGANFVDFKLDYPSNNLSLIGSDVVYVGSSGVDRVYVAKGVKFTFNNSGTGTDEIYLDGSFADYSLTAIGTSTLLLTSTAKANTSITLASEDKVFFSDGSSGVKSLITYAAARIGTPSTPLPTLNTTENSLTLPSTSNLDSILRAYTKDPAGVVFAQPHAGVEFILTGHNGVDKVYVSKGGKVNANNLGTGVDLIYLTGSKNEYSPTAVGTSVLVLTKGTERVTLASEDRVIFADGSTLVKAAITAASGANWQALSLDSNTRTPGLVTDTQAPAMPTLALGAGVSGGATAAEATAATGVVSVLAESGSTVLLTFSDSASPMHTLVKTLTGNGSAQSVQLDSTDIGTNIGTGPASLQDGSITISATATDAAGNISSAGTASFTLDTLAPSISSSATATSAENAGAAQVVYTALATDQGAISYSIKPNTGDASAFSIDSSTGAVTLMANPDFETKPSYSFTVVATDAAGNPTEKPVTLAITNVDEVGPVFSSSATATAIAENSGAAQEVYTAAATDSDFNSPNTASSVTYTLKPNTGDASAFSIDSSTGAVTLTANPDFEAKPSYSFTVVATDAAGNPTEKPVTLAITNVDEVGPVFSSSATATAIAENSGPGQVVYTAAATDSDFNSPNTASSVTYTLKANTGDASAFSIDSSTGAVTLTANPDFEAKPSYSFTVVATDAAGNPTEKPVTLAISNVNEAPTVVVPQAAVTVNEDSSVAIAGISVSDVDAGVNGIASVQLAVAHGTLSVSANVANGLTAENISGNNSASITLIGTQAAINATLASLGYLGNANFNGTDTLSVQSRDGGNPAKSSSSNSVSINVTAINDAPTINGIPANPVDISNAVATALADFSVSDVDGADTTLYVTLTPSNGSIGGFSAGNVPGLSTSITGNTVQLTGTAVLINSALTAARFTPSATGTASLAVRVSDASLTDTSAATSASTNYRFTVSNTPILEISSGQDAYLNNAETSVAVELRFDNLAANDTVQLLLGGSAIGSVHIVSAAEATAQKISLTVAKTDLGADGSKSISAEVMHNGSLATSNALTLTLDTGVPNMPALAIGSGVSGDASSAEATAGNGLVSVTADSDSTVRVTFSDSASHSVIKTLVGSGTAQGVLLADSDLGSGAAKLQDGNISVSATATDAAGNTSTAASSSFTLDTQPPVISTHTFSVNENTQTVGTAAISNTDTVAWALESNGNDNALFAINSASGAITWLAASGANFEAATKSAAGSNSYTLNVSATDAAGNKSTQAITVNLTDVNEAPVTVVPAAAVTVDEDTQIAIAGISVSDVDAGANGIALVQLTVAHGTLSVSSNAANGLTAAGISGNNSTNLTLSGTQTAINATLASLGYQGNPNFNGTDTLSVQTSDGGSPALSNSNSVSINVTAVNDAPSISGIPADTVTISNAVATALADFSVSDVDAANTMLYVTLQPSNGSIGGFTDGTVNGLTVHQMSGMVHLTGTAALINTALAAASFTASAAGTASIAVRVSEVSLDDSAAATSSSAGYRFNVLNTPVLSLSSGQDAYINNAETGVDVEVTFGTLASGDTVQLKQGGSAIGSVHTVSQNEAAAQKISLSIAKVDLGADGSKTISAEVTHSGDPSTASNALTLTLDTTAPDMPALALGSGVSNGATSAEATAPSGVVTVTAELASSVALTFTDSVGHSVTKMLTGTGTALAVTLHSLELGSGAASLQDGHITVYATATDAAGNSSAAGEASFALDTSIATPEVTLGTGVSDGATAAEASAATGVVSVNAESGSTVLLTFSDSASPAHSVVKTITSSGTAQGITLDAADIGSGAASLHDGSISVSASATDAAGNVSSAGSGSFTLDTAIATPELTLGAGVSGGASAAEATASSGVILVNAESGSSVLITFTDSAASPHSLVKTVIGSGTALGISLDSSDIGGAASLQDGTITVSASATDRAGNVSMAGSSSFTLDTSIATPEVTLGTGVSDGATAAEASAATGVVSVNAESGSTVLLTFTDSASPAHSVVKTITSSGTAQGVTLDAADIGSGAASLHDGSISVSASATDPAGNVSTAATGSFTLDTAIATPALTLGTGVADGASAAEATASSGVVNVTAELASTVLVTFADSASHSVIKTLIGSGTAIGVTLDSSDIGGAASLQDGVIHVSASATDRAGNSTSMAGSSSSFTLDTAAPSAPTLALGTGLIGATTAAEATDASGVVSVSADSGSTVLVTFSDSATPNAHSVIKTLLGSGTAIGVVLASTDLGSGADRLQDGLISVSASATDAAGNVSSANIGSSSSFTLDTQPPVISTRTLSVNENSQAVGTATISNVDTVTWALADNADDNALFAIHPSTGAITWQAANGRDFEAATQSAAGNNSYTLSVYATDAAGNQSTQTIAVNLRDVNEAPTVMVPAAKTVAEDTSVAIPGISVSDVDAGANGIASVRLNVANGTLSVSANAANGGLAAAGISDSGSNSLTLTGNAAAINATLATLAYQGALNFNGTDTLSVQSRDGGNPAQSSSNSTVAITVTPVNDAPTVSGIPQSTVSLPTGVTTALADFSVNDVDGTDTLLYVTLTPSNGSIGGFTAGTANGLTTTITGGIVRITNGTAAAINTALAAATFTANAAGTASMVVRVSEVSLADTSPATSSSASFSFNVTSTPVLGIASGQDAYINSTESGVDVEVSLATLALNDTVQLKLGGSAIAGLGVRTVNAAEAGQQKISINIAKNLLGADGSKNITADITKSGGTTSSNALSLMLDTSAPGTPTLALGSGVANGATAAEATATTGVVTVNAELANTVRVTFTDSASRLVIKTAIGTGAALSVTLDNSDITGASRLLDGTIHVSATATDAAGNASPAGASSFTLDSVAPVLSSSSLSIVENASSIGFLASTIANETLTWAIEGSGADNGLFAIYFNTLRWASDTGRDFEAATKSAADTNTYTLTVTATDAAGNKSSQYPITITLQDANDAPVNTVPATTAQAPLTVNEDSDLAFSGSRLISVSDQDAGSNGIASVRLSVQHGTVLVTAAAPNGGLAAGSILNNGTAFVTLSGSATAINATLATLIYRPNANYSGSDTLTVFTTDGSSPALTANSTVAISVTAVNDPPSISGIPAGTANITLGVAAELDNFSVADIDSSTLYLTLTPSNGSINGLSAGTDGITGLMTAIDNNTGRISLTGTTTAINAKLALISFTASAAGAASIAVDVSDVTLGDSSSHASATYNLLASSLAVPVLGIASGQDAILNSADSSLSVQLAMTGLASGDTVQLKLDGSNLGSAYSVTAADISAGKASLTISKSSLGSDGSKAISAVVTHSGAASPASNAINLTLDTSLPGVSLSLGNGVANGATAAEATASTGVVSLTAELGSTVTLSFTDKDNTRITRVITGTGNAQAITLTAAEIGAYANQLHDGTITVNAVAVDRAGNVNTAVSSFVLDTVKPADVRMVYPSTNQAWLGLSTVRNGASRGGDYSLDTFTSSNGWGRFSIEPGASLTVKYFANFASYFGNFAAKTDTYSYTSGDGALQAITLSSADFSSLGLDPNAFVITLTVTDAAGNVTEDVNGNRPQIQIYPSSAIPTLALATGIGNGATQAEAAAGAITVISTNEIRVTIFTDEFGKSVQSAAASAVGASIAVPLAAGQLQDGTITATVYSVSRVNSLSPAASISFVYDTTAPKLAAATIAADRASIVLTFTEAIDSSALTLAAANTNSLLAFKTSTSGSTAINNPFSAISVSGNTVTLTLSTALTASQTATIEYTDAANDQTNAVVQDTAGNDMATLSAFSLSAVPVVSGFVVSDVGNSNGTNRGKAEETVTVQVNFSEAVTLSASTTYTARVQIGSNANYIDATLDTTTTGVPAANSSYSFTGRLPATTGLASNALTLISLSGSGITGSNSRALTQTSYTTLSSNSYLVDSTAPTLTISSAIAAQTQNKTSMSVGDTATITFNFTEDPGSSFAWDGSSGDITVTGGTLSALWGAGQKRYATFVPTPNSSGVASISVAAGSYTDAAGNAGGAGTRTISYDTQPPLTPIIKLGSGVLGGATPAEMVQTGVVTVEAELGQAVTVSFVTTGSSTISKNITGQGKGVAVPVTLSQTDVNSLGIRGLNTITVSATATDGANNQSKSTTSFSYYRTPPAPVAYVFRDSGLNFDDGITNDSFVELDASSVPAGAVAVYTTDAGATWTPVTGGGFYLTKNTTFVANTLGLKNIDAAGNSQIPTYIYFNNANYSTITIDTIAPDAPGVTLLDGLGNSANGATAQITAESGSSVVVTFSDGTRSIPKTVTSLGSGSAVNATLAAGDFGPGAAQLRDGPITVTAVATDLAGNVGAANTSQFVRNSSTPGLSVKSGQDAFVNSTESGVDVYVYTAALASGDTLQLRLDGNNLGSAYPVTASDVAAGRVALTINKADLTGGDGQKSISAVLTQNGTATTSATPLLLTLDTGVPLAPTLQLDGSVQNGASLVEAIASTGVVFVNAESADSVVVTFTDSANRRIVKKVSGQGINTPVAVALLADDIGSRADQLHDGTITISAIATDAAGNASPIGTSSFVLEGTAPAAPVLTLAAAVEGGATRAEASSASGVLRISGLSGATAWLTLSDGVRSLNKTLLLTGGSDALVLAATELGNGSTQLRDGTITVSSVQVDVAGNLSPVANARFVLDSVAPTVPPTLQLGSGVADGANRAEAIASTGVVQVSAEAGASVALTFSDSSSPAHTLIKTVIGLGNTLAAVTLQANDFGTLASQLLDGSISVTAHITADAAGNIGTASTSTTTFTLDATAPGAPVLNLDTTVPTVVTAGSSQKIFNFQQAALGHLLDVVGETGSTATLTFSDGVRSVTKTVQVIDEAPYYENGVLITPLPVNGNSTAKFVLPFTDIGTGASQLHDGTIRVSAVLVDAAGNTSPTSTSSFILDSTAPTVDPDNSVPGIQTEYTAAIPVASANSFNSLSAILPKVAAVSDTDVVKITLAFSNQGSTAIQTGDQLKIGTTLVSGAATAKSLNLNTATDVSDLTAALTLGSLTGLDFRYNQASDVLEIFKHDGSAFTAASINGALGELQFMNSNISTATLTNRGTRDFGLSLFDLVGNTSTLTGHIVI